MPLQKALKFRGIHYRHFFSSLFTMQKRELSTVRWEICRISKLYMRLGQALEVSQSLYYYLSPHFILLCRLVRRGEAHKYLKVVGHEKDSCMTCELHSGLWLLELSFDQLGR